MALRRVAVVGGGISGLAAAHRLLTSGPPGLHVEVFDAADAPGGALRTSPVGGVEVDAGAESFLVRVPHVLDLVSELGLVDAVVHPDPAAQARIFARGRLRPLPAGTVFGVPGDLSTVARSGLLSPAGLARAALDRGLPRRLPEATDVSLGDLVAARLGPQVRDHLVDPLLGGVYAGRSADLSLRATLPALAAEVLDGPGASLLGAAARVRARSVGAPGPVFGSLPGGLGQLVEAVRGAVDTHPRGRVYADCRVRELHPSPAGWTLVSGPVPQPRHHPADAVVLAVPGPPLTRLLGPVAPSSARAVAGLAYASTALVTAAFPRALALPYLRGSGFLVAPTSPLTLKAATFSTRKWPHLAQAARQVEVVRLSAGRAGQEWQLQRDDTELTGLLLAELGQVTGLRALPVDVRVTRWGGGLPQYAPGHLDRVADLRAALPAGLAVCGAAHDGVGVAACVRSGRAAADRILSTLPASPGRRMGA